MKNDKQKKIFLDHLRKIPIIQFACEKSGIGRTTVYRWKKRSKKFSEDMEKAIGEGEELINDMSESQLISLIREKNFAAVRFWLTHRNSKFREKVEVTAKIERQDELTEEQEKTVREAIKLAAFDKPRELTNNAQKNEPAKESGEQKGAS